MEATRASYEARLQALEQRLKAAEAGAAAATAAAPSATVAAATPAPAPAAVAGGGANAFNPAMSLILSGLYGRTSRDPAPYPPEEMRMGGIGPNSLARVATTAAPVGVVNSIAGPRA